MSWTSAKEPVGRAIVHFVRLSMFGWGGELGPSLRGLGLVTPTLEFRFEEIRSADAVIRVEAVPATGRPVPSP